MIMIRLVIFDAGGVLYVGGQKIVERAVRRFLSRHGVNDFDRSEKIWSSVEKLVSVGKISLEQARVRWLEGLGLGKNLLDEWAEVDRKEIWGRLKKTRGINGLLAKLKKKYVLAVLSDTIDSRLEKIQKLSIVGINPRLFEGIFTSHDLGEPSEKTFRSVLEKFSVKPSEAVFVSDAYDELEGAKQIGLMTIGVNCEGGDYLISKLSEIQSILQNLD
jgi:FMN phosphatase YigB (HAD superfamily)